jgi:hypothetical protein
MKRREEFTQFTRPEVDPLLDSENLDARKRPLSIDEGNRLIGCSQVDAYQEATLLLLESLIVRFAHA